MRLAYNLAGKLLHKKSISGPSRRPSSTRRSMLVALFQRQPQAGVCSCRISREWSKALGKAGHS